MKYDTFTIIFIFLYSNVVTFASVIAYYKTKEKYNRNDKFLSILFWFIALTPMIIYLINYIRNGGAS